MQIVLRSNHKSAPQIWITKFFPAKYNAQHKAKYTLGYFNRGLTGDSFLAFLPGMDTMKTKVLYKHKR